MAVRYTGGVTPYSSTGSSLSVTAGRLSYTFGLTGPAISVDTACSSSLVAAHGAINSLRLDQAAAALTAGANITLSPDTPAAFQKAGMLAPDGRCKTLDMSADGYVRAEAVGVLVVRMVSVSSQPPGSLYAAICASAVNQDGRSSALTAPNGPAQQAVVRSALRNSGVQPDQVGRVCLCLRLCF